MYQVLYRKWRPKTFSDVVGQPQVTETLMNEVSNGRISHAYLFTGSRGTGKTTCAKILSHAVNCTSSVDGNPCGKCDFCINYEKGNVLDIVEIDAASNNGVDNIRSLREEAQFTPSNAKYRVYIIDEVHMLSQGAFNALLKTLEEPPKHVIFILATTEVHKLPATILSRCQRFDFHRIPPFLIAERLEYIIEQEGCMIEHDAAILISKLADGALRDALSILDQCIGVNKHVTTDIVNETVGLTGNQYLHPLIHAIIEKDVSEALKNIDKLYNDSKDMLRLAEELSSFLRDIMLTKTVKDANQLLYLSESDYAILMNYSKSITLSRILFSIEQLQSCIDNMNRGNNLRTEIEMTMIRICDSSADESYQSLIERIEKIENQILSGYKNMLPNNNLKQIQEQINPVVIADSKDNDNITNTSNTEINKTKQGLKTNISELSRNAESFHKWADVLKLVKQESRSIAAAFAGSSAYLSNDFILIDAENQMAFELLRKDENRHKLRSIIKTVTGKEYRLGPYQKPDKTEESHDPLCELAEKARLNGIEVIEN